jgi:L-asparaginase
MRRPRVVVVFTGGTISMTVDAAAGGAIPTLAGEDLIAAVPELAARADLVAVDLGRTPASHFTFADVLHIRSVVDDSLGDPRIAGVVVVQGTDTLEETAFAWDLCHDDERPVVVTGAMRDASHSAWDGPANLLAAVRVATARAARGAGVLVVLGGRVHAADQVSKRHATAIDAFATREGPSLGAVGRGGVRLGLRGPRRRLPFVPTAAALPVPIVVAALESTGAPVDAAVRDGARGIVVAATGSGNTHPDVLLAAVEAQASGVPVALASRTGAGSVEPHYAFPGGGVAWAAAGVAFAGGLTAVQARVALALGLGAGLDHAGLARLLADPRPGLEL